MKPPQKDFFDDDPEGYEEAQFTKGIEALRVVVSERDALREENRRLREGLEAIKTLLRNG